MDMVQEVKTLKDQGVADHDLVELLLIKGKNEQEIKKGLEDYYKTEHSTEVHLENKKTNNFLLIVIAVLLIIIAASLGYFIFQSL